MTEFAEMLEQSYRIEEPSLVLGAALEGQQVHPEPKIRLPLSTTNSHGLVAGATGTGKTRTLQLLTDQLSAQGVPVFVADMKGDLSGLAMPGESTPRVSARATDVGWDWKASGVPVEFVSLTGASGVQLRATVSSFGPLLLGKVLALNDTQTSVLTMVFKYADDNGLPLLDFHDLRSVLQYLTSDDGKVALAQYGGMSGATVGVLLRKMIELQSQGADRFFGEPALDLRDLMEVDKAGQGIVSILAADRLINKPRLYATFL